MLNTLEVGTRVTIHRHLKTSETVVCLEGCLDWVFYDEMPGVDTCGPVHDGETAADETQFVETAGLGFAPGTACLVSRCLRELGTQLRCMRLLLFLRLRMGRTVSD